MRVSLFLAQLPGPARSGRCEIRILAAKGQVIRLYIDDPAVVKRILDHLEQRPDSNATRTHLARASPAGFGEMDLDKQ